MGSRCSNGGSSISDQIVVLGLDVKDPGFLALCIRRTPELWVKICVKKCILYMRNYGIYYIIYCMTV